MLAELRKIIDGLANPVPKIETIENPTGHGDIALIKDGYKHVLLPGPMKHQRSHVFHDLRSLAEWLNRHAAQHEDRVEILVTDKEVSAALNPADPYGDRVRCMLTPHPAFTAWDEVFDTQQQHKDFYAFIRGNRDAFIGATGDLIAGQVQRFGLKAGDTLESSVDELGFYRLKGNMQTKVVEGQIPPAFEISVPLIMGVCEPKSREPDAPAPAEKKYTLQVLLSLDVVDTRTAVFMLTCPSLPLVCHQARLDAVAYLTSLLNEGFLVGLGDVGLVQVPEIEA